MNVSTANARTFGILNSLNKEAHVLAACVLLVPLKLLGLLLLGMRSPVFSQMAHAHADPTHHGLTDCC